MKTTNLLTAACTALLMFAACTADEPAASHPNTAPDTPGVMSLTVGIGKGDTPDTRLVYEENDKTSSDNTSHGITLKWAPGDVIYLRKMNTNQKNKFHKYVFTGTASTEATFSLATEEGNTPLEYGGTDSEFVAFTHKSSFITSGDAAIALRPTTELTQDCKKPMAHLSTPSMMLAKGTITEGNKISDVDGGPVLLFKPLLAMVSFDIRLPEGEIPTKVWLRPSGGTQLLSARNIYVETLEPTSSGSDRYTSRLLLNIRNATPNAITAHFLLIPQDLSAVDLQLEVETQKGNYYKGAAFKGANFEAGKHYTATTTQTGGTGGWTKDVITYTSADAQHSSGEQPPLLDTSKPLSSEDNPYLISTAAHLRWLVLNPDKQNFYYRLEKNIHIEDGVTWTPIGNNTKNFKGSFDGDGHTVIGLRTDGTQDYQGFFGSTMKPIKNLHILNGEVKGTKYVGGIVGYMSSGGIVEDCTFSGTVEATADDALLGGIVGKAEGDILRCINTGDVSSTRECNAGGIVGWATNAASLVACSNTGKVEASGSWGIAGGIVGYSTTTQLYACYSTVAASGGESRGGICGKYNSPYEFVSAGCFYLPPQTGGDSYKGIGYKYTTGTSGTRNPADIPGKIEQVADIPALNAKTGTVANPAAGTLNAGIRAWVDKDRYRDYNFHFVPGDDADTPPRIEWGERK